LFLQEWETDYEKRVALLGFLVSPEGKKAFGALYELAKVHEEQEKLRQVSLLVVIDIKMLTISNSAFALTF